MTDYNGCRNYARIWASGLGVNHTTKTRKSGSMYVSRVFCGDDYVGKLKFYQDGTTEWSEWGDSGYIYTEDVDRWKDNSEEGE